jgi:RNA polymerase I-specific transcription initiation factor RRN3
VAIINLINHLVSTNSTFLGRAFQLYIKSLLPSMTTTLSTEASEESTVQYKDLIHRAIRGILIQVPTGRSVLFPILCEFFPHKRFSRNVQTEYTAQLLQICRYEPMLQARILELIVSKCLEMDVEIVIEDSGDVRIDQQALDDGDLDFDDAFEDMAHSFNSSRGHSRNNSRSNMGMGSAGKRKQLTETSAARIPAEVSEMADKLDSVLLLVVQFCEQQITGAGSAGGAGAVQEGASSAVPSSGTRDRLLQQLLGIFENNIMSIHKSKFVQFVIFFAASLHNPFAQAVAEKLVGITLDERASATQRQSAVMYLASYLSRATFLSTEFIRYTAL